MANLKEINLSEVMNEEWLGRMMTDDPARDKNDDII